MNTEKADENLGVPFGRVAGFSSNVRPELKFGLNGARSFGTGVSAN